MTSHSALAPMIGELSSRPKITSVGFRITNRLPCKMNIAHWPHDGQPTHVATRISTFHHGVAGPMILDEWPATLPQPRTRFKDSARYQCDHWRSLSRRNVLWLAGRSDSEVYAIDTNSGKLIARIAVGKGPHGLCLYPQPGRYSLGHNRYFPLKARMGCGTSCLVFFSRPGDRRHHTRGIARGTPSTALELTQQPGRSDFVCQCGQISSFDSFMMLHTEEVRRTRFLREVR
jgi:hypothetical protein